LMRPRRLRPAIGGATNERGAQKERRASPKDHV